MIKYFEKYKEDLGPNQLSDVMVDRCKLLDQIKPEEWNGIYKFDIK